MIPSTNSLLNISLEVKDSPTVQHRMINGRIIGLADGIEALKQTIFKILNTERYDYEIYSWNFGLELVDLIGEPATYCCPELERRIKEALMTDDRIIGIDGFEFDIGKSGTIAVRFTVHSIYGDINSEKVVSI